MNDLSLQALTQRHAQYAPGALPVSVAQAIIDEYIDTIVPSDTCMLDDALGRVLAADIISPINVPPHDNSAMDGYAFNGSVLADGGTLKLTCIGTVLAGQTPDLHPDASQCVRIMTGAVMPHTCDTVIPQEHVARITDTHIEFEANRIRSGENRRHAGEDLMAGQAALKAGRVLRPAELGLIASLGLHAIPVYHRLRVAIFSTGDEICALGEALTPGAVYDSNRYTLRAMLTRLGCEVIDLGIVRDDPSALEASLKQANDVADVIITSGGVSVGAADYTRQIMARLGDVAFWTIGMRPGRPLALGKIQVGDKSSYLFGLPGNPVAVMVTFYFFARQALLRMMGATSPSPLTVPAILECELRKREGRTEYQRGIASIDTNGRLCVRVTGAQGSGILRSMTDGNCFIVLEHERGNIAAGETVHVALFEGLI